MKKYVEQDGQTFKVEVYYSLGGINYFSCDIEKRGYYLSVCPVARSTSADGVVMETYKAFSGTKILIKEVTRKSNKSYEESIKLAESSIQTLIDSLTVPSV